MTAGNASGRNDGASAFLMMNEEKVNEYGIKPKAKMIAHAVSGVSPEIMGIGPVDSTLKALKQVGLTINDIGLIELNEAFASQALSVIRETEMDIDKVNVNGGAIALWSSNRGDWSDLNDEASSRNGTQGCEIRVSHTLYCWRARNHSNC